MLLSSPPPMPVSPAVSPDFLEQKKSVLTPRSEISLADAKSHLKPASSARCPDPGPAAGFRLRPGIGRAEQGSAAPRPPIALISRLGDGRRPGRAFSSSANCISSPDRRSRGVRRGSARGPLRGGAGSSSGAAAGTGGRGGREARERLGAGSPRGRVAPAGPDT